MNARQHAPTRDDFDAARRRRLLLLGSITAVVLLVLVGVGVYGLVRGPSPTPPAGDPPVTPTVPSPVTISPLSETRDAETFAAEVAERLFDWDAGLEYSPADYLQPIVTAADEREAIAVAADARGYFPDTQAWTQLRQMQARQWLGIDRVSVPDAWTTAVQQAKPGQLPEGAVAVTIDGTRHRTAIWGDQPAAIERPVAFTVFLVCPPGDACRLLRLSALDQPLR